MLAAAGRSASACEALQSEAPISTDRPGFLFSPTVVPSRRLQIEMGLPAWLRARGQAQELDAWSGSVALRFGLSRAAELRASLPPWTTQRFESGGVDEHARGWGDAEIGAKFMLSDSVDAPWAVQASLRLPTGEAPFTTDELGATGYVLHGRSLGRGWSGLFMAGVLHTPADGAPDTTQGAIGALASLALADGWSVYGELAILPGLHDLRGQSYAGAGLTCAVTEDCQLDLSCDFGLDRDSADGLAALGVSFRL